MGNKISTIKERILFLLEYKGIVKSRFFQQIGMTYGNFTGESKKTPLNSDAIGNILLEIPDVSVEWLITGKGEMLKNNQQIGDISNSTVVGSNVSGDNNTFPSPISEEISRNFQEIIKKNQEQIDKLLLIIEKLST
jgi:hypothetical protein